MIYKETYRELKQNIIIVESKEEMLDIPSTFLRFDPHPYQLLNAPYGDKSPFFLREDALRRLKLAQERLCLLKHGYKLKIFDAYRPLEVQSFMIEYDKNRLSKEMFDAAFDELTKEKQDEVKSIVLSFWSPISENVTLNPPPHSTGGALDLTIVDANGLDLDMGTQIDELTEASMSDFYKGSSSQYEKNRELLKEVMTYASFTQLPTEWWHFSYGDQIWAIDNNTKAKYGIYNKSV